MGEVPQDSGFKMCGSETQDAPHEPPTGPAAGQSHPPNGLFVAFFFSGAAGLIYEVAWTKSLGLFFGHTVYANATVLGIFMGGLAAGSAWIGRWSDRSTRPLALYGWIEVAVAITGASSILGLTGLRHFYAPLYLALSASPSLILALRFFGASLVLLLPTFLMGGTFPVLVRSLSAKSEDAKSATELGWGVSRLYWVNTLGAVAGTLAAGFTLIPLLGLRASVAFAAGLNLMAAGIAFRFARGYQIAPTAAASGKSSEQDRTTTADPTSSESFPSLLLVVFGVVGATAMTYEIAWARLLGTVLGSSTYAFTLMLSTFLAGIVLGSLLFERSSARHTATVAVFAHTQTFTALAALLFLAFFRELPAIIPPILRATNQTFGGLILAQFLTCTLAMLPAAVAFGFNFPAAVTLIAASIGRGVQTAEAVGLAYAANTSGAILAAVITGFFVVPWIGSFRVVALSATLNVLLAAVLLLRCVPRRKALLLTNAAIAAMAVYAGWSSIFYDRALASFGTVLYWSHRSERLTLEERAHLQDIVFLQDGLNATIAVSRSDGYIALKTNGKVDASTVDTETQLLLGHLGAIFHPHPRNVLVIGFGSGMTASALLRYPDVERLDCVEIEPAVLRAAPFLEQLNRGALRDSRLHVVLEDARNALLTTRDRYDLIVSEPSNPWIAGIATLYTDEYYRTVRQHLASGGMFVQWIQGYSLEPADLSMILATIVPHFPDVTLWHSTGPDFLVLARTDTKSLDFDRSRLLWGEPGLREDFKSLWLTRPESWPIYFSLNDSEVRVLAQGAMRNTDDRTLLEYRAPRAMIGTSHVTELISRIKQVQKGLLPAELRDSERRATLEASAESGLALPDSRSMEFVRALDGEPPTASLEVVRGRLSLRENNVGLALEHFQRAVGLEPNDTNALIWMARAKHLTPGDTEGSEILNQILKRDPQNLEALADRVDFDIARRDWPGAAEALATRIRILKNAPSGAYCRLGDLLARSGNLLSAAEAFRTGIDRDPYSYLCHLGLGEIARASGRFEEARKDFEYVVRYYPDANSGVYLSMAAVYRAQGDRSRAQDILNKGHRIFPDDPKITQMMHSD